jgi:hypothetical protein
LGHLPCACCLNLSKLWPLIVCATQPWLDRTLDAQTSQSIPVHLQCLPVQLATVGAGVDVVKVVERQPALLLVDDSSPLSDWSQLDPEELQQQIQVSTTHELMVTGPCLVLLDQQEGILLLVKESINNSLSTHCAPPTRRGAAVSILTVLSFTLNLLPSNLSGALQLL